MKIKWNYDTQKIYLNELFIRKHSSYQLTADSKLIKDIITIYSQKFPDHKNLADATLSNMVSLYLNNKKTAFMTPDLKDFGKNQNKFWQNPNKKISLHKNKLKENLILTNLTLMDKEEFPFPNLPYDINLTPSENIEHYSKNSNLTPLEVACILYKQEDIVFMNDEIMRSSKFEEQTIQKTSNNYDNHHRTKIAEIFNHETNDYNLFLLNDGTGSGKTYNVVHSYLDSYDNYSEFTTRRNLVFMAPQKNQLYVDSGVYKKAESKNIPILFLRSQEDLVNLSSKSFLTYNSKTNSFEDLSIFFESLFKSFTHNQKVRIDSLLKSIHIQKIKDRNEDFDENEKLKKIPSFLDLERIFKNYSTFESTYAYFKEVNQESYEEELEQIKRNFRNTLDSLAKLFACNIDENTLFKIFNFGGVYKGFSDFNSMFKDKDKFYELAYWLIAYVLPFEAAKYINCVIFMTGQKSQTSLPIIVDGTKKQGTRVVKSSYLEALISGYSVSSQADIIKHIVNRTPFDSFINNEYFVLDTNNYFVKHNIPFSLVIDEEHELYNEFIDKNTTKRITDPIFGNQVNVIHACAGISRWFDNVNAQGDFIASDRITQEKTKIINRLINQLSQHTVLHTANEVFEFFKFFLPNELGVFIEEKNYAAISDIFHNIVAYTPKIILRKEELDEIKISLIPGESKIILSKTPFKISNSKQYSALDFLQIILTTLYVLKDCSNILKSLNESELKTNNQNNALYNFIHIACQNKDFLENLFTSSLQLKDSDPITLSFVYILSKICFNFNLRDKIKSDYFITELIPIEPEISIIRELPEIFLLQALKNPRNKAFLLSATRGFNNNYSGSYSEQFFEYVTNSIPGALKILKRENLENNSMPQFIEDRFSKRNSITFNSIEFEHHKTTTNNENDIANIQSYRISDIKLSDLNKSNTVHPTIHQEFLTSQDKNYLNSAIFTAKSNQLFSSFGGKYHKQEFLNILDSIRHTYLKDKNAMILGLSNKFYSLFMKNSHHLSVIFKNYNCLLEDKSNKIIEFTPTPNGKKVRLVFFDAELGKMPTLKDSFIESKNTLLIVVSSYKSAGTGLNLTIETTDGKKDFDSIYFVTDTFWTSIKTKNGINSLNNLIIVSKHLQHLGNKTISDLVDGVFTKDNRSLLAQEHLIEQTKVILQGLGRVERTDNNIDTNVYFVKSKLCDMFTLFMTRIYRLFKIHSPNYETTAIANLSMNGKAAIKTAVNYIESNSFSNKQRKCIETKTQDGYKTYADFFENIFPKLLKNFREGDLDYRWFDEFNSIIREYYYPTYDFKGELVKFITKHENALKKINLLTKMKELVQYAYFDFEEENIPKNIQISDLGNFYSDLTISTQLLSDDSLFGYCSGLYSFEDKFLSKITEQLSYSEISLTNLPNPYLKNIIQGNVAEYVCLEYIKYIKKTNKLNFEINNIKKLFGETIYLKTYELVDIYITYQGKIFGIDVKSWGLYHDGGFKKLIQRLPIKHSALTSTLGQTHRINMVYVNMHPNINPSADGGTSRYLKNYPDVHYFDFFNKKLSWKTSKDNKNYLPDTEFYLIDNTLEKLL